MALKETKTHLSLAGGVDERTPRALLPPDKMSMIENCSIVRTGELRKRAGFSPGLNTVHNSASVTLTDIDRMFAYGDRLLMTDGARLFERLDTRDGVADIDPMPNSWIDVSTRATVAARAAIHSADVAVSSGGYGLIAWATDLGNLYAQLFDYGTGAVYFTTLVGTVHGPFGSCRVLERNGVFKILATTAGKRIIAFNVDSTAAVPAVSAATTIVTDAILDGGTSATDHWDCCTDGGATANYYVTYRRDGAAQCDLKSFVFATDAAVSAVVAAGDITLPALVYVGSVLYWAFFNAAFGVLIEGRTTAMSVAFSVQTVNGTTAAPLPDCIVLGAKSASSCWVVWHRPDDPVTDPTVPDFARWRGVSSAGALDAVTNNNPNWRPFSKPFTKDGVAYIVAVVEGASGNNSGLCLLDIQSPQLSAGSTAAMARIIGQFMVGRVDDNWKPHSRPFVTADPSGNYASVFMSLDPSSGLLTLSASVELCQFVLGDEPRFFGDCSIGGLQFFAGGLPSVYDGKSVFECGFAYAPKVEDIRVAAGGTLVDGVWEYRFIYEYRDNQGRLWQSLPSPIVNISTDSGAGNQTVVIRVANLTLTNRPPGVNGDEDACIIHAFRRGPGATSDAPFVRLRAAGVTTGVYRANGCFSALNSAFTDTGASFTSNAEPNLYTFGGYLENAPPGPCKVSCVFDNRVFIADCEDRRVLRYTKELIGSEGSNEIGLEFNEVLEIRVDEGGPITGLSVQDAYLLVFKSDSIFFLQGTGPNDRGEAVSYTAPQRLTSDVGCVDARSIVSAPTGTLFQSRRGIHIINRKLGVEFIGAEIEVTLPGGDGPNGAGVIGALIPKTNEAVFLVDPDTSRTAAVYNYLYGVWYTWVWAATDAVPTSMATLTSGAHWWGFSGGWQARQDEGTFGDYDFSEEQDEPIHMRLETGDISFDGPAGVNRYWRAVLNGSQRGAHGISVQIATGQAAGYQAARTWTSSEIGAFPQQPVLLFELLSSVQECRAIRFLIEETNPTNDAATAGPAWYTLSFEHGVESGTHRVPAAQKK